MVTNIILIKNPPCTKISTPSLHQGWNDKAKAYVKSLDSEVKKEIVSLLLVLQRGYFLSEPQSKPLKQIHKNAYELRIKEVRVLIE